MSWAEVSGSRGPVRVPPCGLTRVRTTRCTSSHHQAWSIRRGLRKEFIVLRFSGAGVSDIGRVRAHNEDSGFVGPYVAIVADGGGGAAAGEIASATAAYSASAVALGRFGDRPEAVLAEAHAAAGAGVRLGVQRDLDRLGMATTLTMLVTDGRSVALGHV